MNRNSNIMQYVKDDNRSSRYGFWQVRENAEVRALSDADRAVVEAAVNRHNSRKERGDWRPVSKRTDYVALLVNQVAPLVRPFVERMYRTDVSGSTTIKIGVGKPLAIGFTSKNWNVYSKATRYPGHDAVITVNVMHGWRRHVLAVPGLVDAGGMLTTHAKQVEPGVWEATWITQGRGVDLNVAHGYIIGAGDNWAHAATLAAAKRMLAKRTRQAEINTLAAALSGMTYDEIVAQYGNVIVKPSDSTAAGNCPSGTQTFAEMFFAGRKAATVAELFAVGKMQSYVKRAATYAIARQQ